MNAEAIITVSAAVVALTQFAKWAGVDDKHGPLAVIGLSLVGVLMYGVSQEIVFARSTIWPYFAGWVAITMSAAGVFGFTRASGESLVKTSSPPPGGGANPTIKSGL